MPLSEQEQRLLDEMERNLYQNDADFVATVGVRRPRSNYRSVAVGVLIGVVGVGLLVTGVGIHQPVVGVFGFLLMFAGVLIAVTPPRVAKPGSSGSSSASGRTKGGSSGIVTPINDRADRRPTSPDE